MATLKPFVQQAVRALELSQLQLLSETLRVDLRGCDDRTDIERVLTGLLCLDQDSSLGVFLGWWLQINQRQQELGKQKSFQTTFVPAITPVARGNQSPTANKTTLIANKTEEEHVPEHHLDNEISERLKELEILERDFKVAERGVHTGSPSFDKLKSFLVGLAQLRNKEEETRRFLLRQTKLLRAQHDDMQQETLHTRAQLDFFVAGFSNLRQRHDALLEKATRLAAENESAHALFVEMSAEDAHFAVLATNTLQKQLVDMQVLRDQVRDRDEQLARMQLKQDELMKCISSLKQQRGDARKDAHCYKQQLRICRERMKATEQSALDATILRQQSNELRSGIANLLSTHLRDAIQRDTKSTKQSLSKEALKIIQRITVTHVANPSGNVQQSDSKWYENEALDQLQSRKRSLITRHRDSDSLGLASAHSDQGRIIKLQTNQWQDLDEVIKGMILAGGDANATVKCVALLAERLKYLPVDVAAAIEEIRVREEQDVVSTGEASDSTISKAVMQSSVDPDTAPPIAKFSTQLGILIRLKLQKEQKRAFVLYNWPFSSADVDILKAGGLSIDSIIDLQVSPPIQPRVLPPSAPKPVLREGSNTSSLPKTAISTSRAPTPGTSSRGKVTTTALDKAQSPSKPAKAVSSSPAKPIGKASTPSVTKVSTRAAKTVATSVSTPKSLASKSTTTSKAPATEVSSPAKSPQKSPTKSPTKSPAKSTSKSPPKPAAKSPPKVSPGKVPLSTTAKLSSTSPKKTPDTKKPVTPTSPSRPPTSSGAKIAGSSSVITLKNTSNASAGAPSTTGLPSPKQVQQPKRPTDQRAAFKTQLPLYQSIPPTTFDEERVDAIVNALEREKSKRLLPVIRWDEEGQRTQEQLAMFGEEILMLLAIEQENRKPTAKRGIGGPSSSTMPTPGSSSSSMTTSRSVASRGTSRVSSPVKDAKSPGKASKSPTASDKKPPSPTRRPTELVGNSPSRSPPPAARRLTQQPTSKR